MRGIVVASRFPGVPSLEADLTAGRPTMPGGLSFSERGRAICQQALGHVEDEILPRPPSQESSESDFSSYYTADIEHQTWFRSDRLEGSEFLNLFMSWGFDLSDGRGNLLKSYVYFYRVMEGLARGALVVLPTPALEPWRRRRLATANDVTPRWGVG